MVSKVIHEWTRETAYTPEAKEALTEFDPAKHDDAVAEFEFKGLRSKLSGFKCGGGAIYTEVGEWRVRDYHGEAGAFLTRLTYLTEPDSLPDFANDPSSCIILTREQVTHPDFEVPDGRAFVWFNGNGDGAFGVPFASEIDRWGFSRAYLLRSDKPA